MMLSDVPWESLCVGDVVTSCVGDSGKIYALKPFDEDNIIVIEWFIGGYSTVCHSECNTITYDVLSTLVVMNVHKP